ncbi:MAG: hypothetical protein L0H23_09250, partial [Luteimonas sp.]|nr:hypothetical protein [Luteimonas sp.]
QTGRILAWRAPAGKGLRADHCVETGGEVSPYYDSMVGKLIAWGPNREVARSRLIGALDQTLFLGVASNKDFLRRILRHETFAGGDFDIHFIDKHMPRDAAAAVEPSLRHGALAAAIAHAHDANRLVREHGLNRGFLNWRSANAVPSINKLARGDQSWELRLSTRHGAPYEVTIGGYSIAIQFTRFSDSDCHYVCDGVQARADYAIEGRQIWVRAEGATWAYTDTLLQPPETAGEGDDGRVVARMDGKILDVSVAAGECVMQGQKLLVLEAMKWNSRWRPQSTG